MRIEHLNTRNLSQLSLDPQRISMRCPICLREGTLDPRRVDLKIQTDEMPWAGNRWLSGERVCPNPECRALIYIVYKQESGEVVYSYPAERVDFDASKLPDQVKETFEEAIACHSDQCYRASAVMIRRTLEVLCEDQGATGKNLKDRISKLGENLILPKGFLGGLHNLRFLGNDAAHVEAKLYEDIGKREIEIALDVVKILLGAAYQMESVLDELESLKASPSTNP